MSDVVFIIYDFFFVLSTDDRNSIVVQICRFGGDGGKLSGGNQRCEIQQPRHAETRPFPQPAGPSEMQSE